MKRCTLSEDSNMYNILQTNRILNIMSETEELDELFTVVRVLG